MALQASSTRCKLRHHLAMHHLGLPKFRAHPKQHAAPNASHNPDSCKHDAASKQHPPYAEVDAALEQIGAGRFQVLLLSCICLVWAGDAAEVMVLSFLGPAVRSRATALCVACICLVTVRSSSSCLIEQAAEFGLATHS